MRRRRRGGPGGPILVVTDPGDPFGRYYAEILRAEGLNRFAVTTKAGLSAATLAGYQVVLLARDVGDAPPRWRCSTTRFRPAAI